MFIPVDQSSGNTIRQKPPGTKTLFVVSKHWPQPHETNQPPTINNDVALICQPKPPADETRHNFFSLTHCFLIRATPSTPSLRWTQSSTWPVPNPSSWSPCYVSPSCLCFSRLTAETKTLMISLDSPSFAIDPWIHLYRCRSSGGLRIRCLGHLSDRPYQSRSLRLHSLVTRRNCELDFSKETVIDTAGMNVLKKKRQKKITNTCRPLTIDLYRVLCSE